MSKSLKFKLFALVETFFATLKAPIEEIGTVTLNSREGYIVHSAFSPNSDYLAFTTNHHQVFVFSTSEVLPGAIPPAGRDLETRGSILTWSAESRRLPLVGANAFVGFHGYESPNFLQWSPGGSLSIADQYGRMAIFQLRPNDGLGLVRLQGTNFKFLPSEQDSDNREYLLTFKWINDDSLICVARDMVERCLSIHTLNRTTGQTTRVQLQGIDPHQLFGCYPAINPQTNRVAIGINGCVIIILNLQGQEVSRVNLDQNLFIKYLDWAGNELIAGQTTSKYGRNFGTLSVINTETRTIRNLGCDSFPIAWKSQVEDQLIIQERNKGGQFFTTSLANPEIKTPIEGLVYPTNDSNAVSPDGRFFTRVDGPSMTIFRRV